MKETLSNFVPTFAGGGGVGLLSITPGDVSNAGQIIIVLATVFTQLFSLFKKKKAEQPK